MRPGRGPAAASRVCVAVPGPERPAGVLAAVRSLPTPGHSERSPCHTQKARGEPTKPAPQSPSARVRHAGVPHCLARRRPRSPHCTYHLPSAFVLLLKLQVCGYLQGTRTTEGSQARRPAAGPESPGSRGDPRGSWPPTARGSGPAPSPRWGHSRALRNTPQFAGCPFNQRRPNTIIHRLSGCV